MNVLIIHNAGDPNLPSGELTVVNDEVNALRRKGINVYLYVIRNDVSRELFSKKALIAGINIFWSFSFFMKTKKMIDKYRPDIVHFHGILPLLTPSVFYACRKKGVPVVQTLHNFRWICVEGGLFKDGRYCDICVKNTGFQGVTYGCSRGSKLISFLLWLVNLIYRKSGLLYLWVDKFITVSEFVKNKFIDAGFPVEKLQVKYNAAPVLPVDELLSVKKIERSGLTFVGRIAPAKGTRIIKEIIRNIKLPVNIIGDGPDRQFLKQYCQSYSLDHVKFWGQIPHNKVLNIISSSQCVVVPSICGETFSLVAVEALFCGIPVIGSKLGGLVELISKSGGGILVDPEHPEAFVDVIHKLMKHPSKMSQMGVLGKKYVQEKLVPEIITNELLQIYKEVIDEKNTRK